MKERMPEQPIKPFRLFNDKEGLVYYRRSYPLFALKLTVMILGLISYGSALNTESRIENEIGRSLTPQNIPFTNIAERLRYDSNQYYPIAALCLAAGILTPGWIKRSKNLERENAPK